MRRKGVVVDCDDEMKIIFGCTYVVTISSWNKMIRIYMYILIILILEKGLEVLPYSQRHPLPTTT